MFSRIKDITNEDVLLEDLNPTFKHEVYKNVSSLLTGKLNKGKIK